MSSANTLPDPEKPLLLNWLPRFDFYLSQMESFLDQERQEFEKIRDDVLRKVQAGELSDPDDPTQDNLDFEVVQNQIKMVDEFRNILRRSYLVTLYAYLESRLMRECRRRQREANSDPTVLTLSETGGKGVQKAVLYLVKVHKLPFSREKSPEWSEVQHYDRLRNYILHNEARLTPLDLQDSNGKKLADYIR